MVHPKVLIKGLPVFLLWIMVLLNACTTPITTSRVSIVSVMNPRNDLGVKGEALFGVGSLQYTRAILFVTKASAGIEPLDNNFAGSTLAGLEFMKVKGKTGFRGALFAGPKFVGDDVSIEVEANVGIFEFFKGKHRKFGGLALEMSFGYVIGNFPFSGFWYGVGLSWQYDRKYGDEE
jgi:hypothetical protein